MIERCLTDINEPNKKLLILSFSVFHLIKKVIAMLLKVMSSFSWPAAFVVTVNAAVGGQNILFSDVVLFYRRVFVYGRVVGMLKLFVMVGQILVSF